VPDLAAEFEGMGAVNNRRIVQELKRTVIVLVRSLGVVSKTGVDPRQGDIRDAPLHGRSAVQSGDLEFAHYIAREGQLRTGRIVELRKSKARLGHNRRAQHACVRPHVLVEVGDDGGRRSA